jgi:hypothetical protein
VKLTEKDAKFLETLKRLMESKDLWVELTPGKPSYMVLRGTYGDKVYRAFRMTRQGVRWRFQRIYNDIYISAFEALLFVETTFGAQLREHAIRISKERYALRQEAMRSEFENASTVRGEGEDSPKLPISDGDQTIHPDHEPRESTVAEGAQFRKPRGDGR